MHSCCAAELFFRPQRVTAHDGTLLLADAETIELHEHDRHASPLLEMLGGPAVTEAEVLDEQGAEHYFDRSDAFDLVLNLGGSGRARRGLADAMTIWIRHLLGVEVTIEAVARMDEENWAWFVGLDSEATRIGNALWRQEEIEPEWLERIIGLFRLEFIQPLDALPMIDGRSVWLILAMTEDRLVRMKPQNLIPACRFGPAPGCTDMAREVIEVGVVVERRKLKSPWASSPGSPLRSCRRRRQPHLGPSWRKRQRRSGFVPAPHGSSSSVQRRPVTGTISFRDAEALGRFARGRGRTGCLPPDRDRRSGRRGSR